MVIGQKNKKIKRVQVVEEGGTKEKKQKQRNVVEEEEIEEEEIVEEIEEEIEEQQIEEEIEEIEEEIEEETDEKTKIDKKNPSLPTTFRIITGSYEHNLLCVSLSLFSDLEVFNPVFHFTAHTQSIRCLAQSKRYLTSGSNDEHIRIYDLQKRKELGTLLHHSGSITVLEFFESKWLLSGAGDGIIAIWRTKDWEVLGELKGHKGAVNDLSIHPSGKIALSVGEDKTLRLWNLMTARKASIIKLGAVGLKVKWSLDGNHYIIGYDRKIELFTSNADKICEESFTSPLQHLDVTDIGENSNYLVTSHNNGRIVFTNLNDILNESTEPASFELVGHAVRVKHFSFYHHVQNDKYYMASVSSDGKLVIWDLAARDQVAVYNTGDRLNCSVIVPEDVEKADTMKKRSRIGEEDGASDTDFSEVESDVDVPKKNKKKNKKRAKVVVEFEKDSV